MKHIMRRKTLTMTIAENKCEYLVITNFKSDLKDSAKKDAIILSARVHPGESSSSHVMEGLLTILTGDSQKALDMRDKFLFKVVPMLNPDGVITGNYRTNLAGFDLNRNWSTPDKKFHPTIHFAKKMIEDLGKSKNITLYIDIHNHSRKKNIFSYGCTGRGCIFRLLIEIFRP